MKILLIENKTNGGQLLKTLLMEAGYEVIHVGYAEPARKLIQAGAPFDLVLTDLWVPADPCFPRVDAHGWDVAHETRRKGIPVILHSEDPLAAERAIREGYRFVKKGEVEELFQVIREIIRSGVSLSKN